MNTIFFPIVATLTGFLASSAFFLEKIPSLRSVLDQLKAYQAIIGVVALFVSVFTLIDIMGFRVPFSIRVITSIAAASTAVSGFLLGITNIRKFFETDQKVSGQIEDIKNKLIPYQAISGLMAFACGLYLLIRYFF
jgi:hypothetical protein